MVEKELSQKLKDLYVDCLEEMLDGPPDVSCSCPVEEGFELKGGRGALGRIREFIGSEEVPIVSGENGSLQLAPGHYELELVIVDSDDARGRATVNITVVEPFEPGVTTESNELCLAALVLLLIVLVLAGIAIWRLRTRDGPDHI